MQEYKYGMGWVVIPPSTEFAFCKSQRFVASHTGGAVGASSVLLILPSGSSSQKHMLINLAFCKFCAHEDVFATGFTAKYLVMEKNQLCCTSSMGLFKDTFLIDKERKRKAAPWRIEPTIS